jgi:hypothetical protein
MAQDNVVTILYQMPYDVKTAINDFLSMNHQINRILEHKWQSLDEEATN